MLWMLFSYTYRHCNGCIRKAEKSPPGIDVISEFISHVAYVTPLHFPIDGPHKRFLTDQRGNI